MQVSLTACALGLLVAGCSDQRKVPGSKRVDVLDLPRSTIKVPAGWNVTKQASAPDLVVLVLDRAVSGFLPSIVVEELVMGQAEHEQVKVATEAVCRDPFQRQVATAQDVDPGFVRTFSSGAFTGCDYEVRAKQGPQAARQIVISNGTITLSFVCNRDRQPPPDVDVDGACEALARAITPK
jgi:hypothetical protein